MLVGQPTALYAVPPYGGVYQIVGWDHSTKHPYVIKLGGKYHCSAKYLAGDVEYFATLNEAKHHSEWCENNPNNHTWAKAA